MNCPVCDAKTIVVDTRKHEELWKRRRECTKCFTRFNTYEKIDFGSIPDYIKSSIR